MGKSSIKRISAATWRVDCGLCRTWFAVQTYDQALTWLEQHWLDHSSWIFKV